MKFIPHLIFLLTAFSLAADEKAEKLLNLAGFTSHSSKNLQLRGFGSGFAVTSDGYVITASHVTDGSDAVRVIFKDGKSYDAKVVKEERGLDLAILKIEAQPPAFLSVSSRTAELGDEIYTIGYPSPLILGTNQKFTKGSISALTGLKNNSFRYQISVPIQPGNSGGAVVSEETGEVVGIVVSSLKGKEVVGFNPQNVNYALKSGFIRPIMDAFEIKLGKVKAAVSKNERRQRVVDAACMVIACKFNFASSAQKNITLAHPKAESFSLLGGASMAVKQYAKFDDPGYLPSNADVEVKGNVNVNVLGSYELEYAMRDAQGKIKTLNRRVNVVKNEFWKLRITQPRAANSFFSKKTIIEVYVDDNFVGQVSELELKKEFNIIGKSIPESTNVKMFKKDFAGKKLFYNQHRMVAWGDDWKCFLGANVKNLPL